MSEYNKYTGGAIVGSALTYTPTGRFPIVGGTVYETYQDLIDYVKGNKSTAIGGSILFVVADEDETKRGAYEVLFIDPTARNTDGQIKYFVDGVSNLTVRQLHSEISDVPTEPVEDIHLTGVELTTENDNKTYLVFTLSYTDEPIKVDVSELTNSAVVYEIESGTEETDYVHINIVSDDENLTKTLNVTTKTVALEDATEENDGLTTAVDVKNYIDTKATETLDSAKTYADETIETAIETATSELQTYADGKATDALNSAKEYTDTTIETAKTEINTAITTAAEGAVTTANAYTDEQIAALGNISGDATLENDITSNIKVGFLEAGTTLTEGMTLTEILTRILVKEIFIKTTNPEAKLTLNSGIEKEREIGTALGTVNFTLGYIDGYYSSADTTYYSNDLFNTKNNTTDGKLNAGCPETSVDLYCDNVAVTGSNTTYTNDTVQTSAKTFKFHTISTYGASTVNTAYSNLGNPQEVSIVGGTDKSNEISINFYYTTKVEILTGVVWNELSQYLDLNGVEYVPSTTLKDSMTLGNGGELLKSKTQNQTELITLTGNSSLAVFVPKDKTFVIYADSDTNKVTNLFGNFKKYSTTNTMGIEYDIYIYTNNSSADTKFLGLEYSAIQ